MALLLTLYVVIPVFVLVVLAARAKRGLSGFAVSAAVAIFVLVFFHQVLRWDVPGLWARPIGIIAVLGLILWVAATTQRERLSALLRSPRPSGVIAVGLIVAAVPAALYVIREAPSPGGELALARPLNAKRLFVAQGGGTPLLNHHHAVAAQRHALDLTALGSDGARAEGWLPASLDAYRVHGVAVLAPCAGEVVARGDGAPNQPIGVPATERPAGNFLAIACGGATVVLAHLAANLEPAVGDHVSVGDRVGFVGNSGATTEPHLHIHAVRGRVADIDAFLYTAEGAPLTFAGRALRRNDVLTDADWEGRR